MAWISGMIDRSFFFISLNLRRGETSLFMHRFPARITILFALLLPLMIRGLQRFHSTRPAAVPAFVNQVIVIQKGAIPLAMKRSTSRRTRCSARGLLSISTTSIASTVGRRRGGDLASPVDAAAVGAATARGKSRLLKRETGAYKASVVYRRSLRLSGTTKDASADATPSLPREDVAAPAPAKGAAKKRSAATAAKAKKGGGTSAGKKAVGQATETKHNTAALKKAAAAEKKKKTAEKKALALAERRKDSLPRTTEKKILARGSKGMVVCGIDEAGRGPLAGPVVAAACHIPMDIHIEGIQDSKIIGSEARREELYDIITTTKGIRWTTSTIEVAQIDSLNIREATKVAMTTCAHTLRDEASAAGEEVVALVDGDFFPAQMEVEAVSLIGGDGSEFCIAAASILAKVTRDRVMRDLDARYPQYGFDKNKGYGTVAHRSAIVSQGYVEGVHRRTFNPLKDLLKSGAAKLLPIPNEDKSQ